MKVENQLKSRRIDYKLEEDYFYGARFIFECGYKLKGNPLTLATAATIYHRFYREVDFSHYDKYLIAATALYVAGKMSDDYKLRDVINVAHYTLHKSILDLKDEYWMRRDALLQAELLVMRVLKFKVDPPECHRYLLHYLKSLQGWLDRDSWERVPVAQSSLAFLQDLHHSPQILDATPQDLALACLYITLQSYGLEVAPKEDWFTALYKDANLGTIIDTLLELYNKVGN
ncbi:unnamed protein product [Nezara viridula]|uniref:Cyclin-Q n=1 Tax=Nezara viridula TaxID=85310 RepID=A0A9P0HCF8_NEZVI|nr:unnamed protein product [Nezara viridula]